MPVDHKMLLKDLGELCNTSDVMTDVFKTYEKRKNLLNKLVSNDYLLQNTNIVDENVITTTTEKSTPELKILKDILNSVKNNHTTPEFKTTPESPELVENICKTLITNNDFREYLKDHFHDCNNCSRLNNDEKKIKIELLVNNNNDLEPNNREYSIGIYRNHVPEDSKFETSSRGYKRKYQHVVCGDEDNMKTQTLKMKSILKKISEQPIKKQRFFDPKKQNALNNLSYYTE